LHRGWRLECGAGGSGHSRSQTSHCVILNDIIVKKVEFERWHPEKLRYCFLNIV
jgi:hypothetical protein